MLLFHRQPYRPLSHLIIICTLSCPSAFATCFYPNGTADDTNRFLPCKPSDQSMCCLINPQVVDAADADTCDPNGLCIPSDNNGVWRGLCTDQSWEDPACINLCTTGASVDNSSLMADARAQPLTTCGDKSLCCGNIFQHNGANCCSKRKGVFLENGKLGSTTTSVSATSAPTASSNASTSTPPSFASPSPLSASRSALPALSSSNNTGAIIGGVLGGVAGIVVGAMVFWYFMIRRKTRQKAQPELNFEQSQGEEVQRPSASEALTDESWTRREELEGPRRGELNGLKTTQELEGWQASECEGNR